MLLTEYLDSIENTAEEQDFINQLAELREHLVMAANTPFVGKKLRALIALADIGNISEFNQTAHYDAFDGWNITLHKFGGFSIHPGKEKMLKAMACVGAIAGLIALVVLLIKRRR